MIYYVGKPWFLKDFLELFIRKIVIDWQLVGRCVWDTREVIGDNVFDTLFISNFEIKLLKKEDPINKSVLRILLKH